MKTNNEQLPNNSGFTIIEVLFVLAIAGFILALVFQAIPALTRSSRNSQRKQDVATILRAVSQYELKDSGNFPLSCNSVNLCTSNAGASNPNDYFLRIPVSNKVRFYSADKISLNDQTLATRTDLPAVTDPNVIQIYNYENCDDNNLGQAIIKSAGYNDVVALYALETGNGFTSQCQKL